MLNGPKLAGHDAWYLRRQLVYYQTGVRGAHPGDLYGQQMAPMANVVATDQAMRDVIAYIETFPDNPVEATIVGDVERGRRIYRTCGSCHGWEGQGIQALKAPRAAGLQDWYLARQLHNFKRGIRGAHPQDLYGQQMIQMANVLVSDRAIDDVVAYINTLPSAPARLAMIAHEEQ
jgi:cytochrome c oxidase subunit II